MTKVPRANLRGDWQRCLIREGDMWVILDSECWRSVNRSRGLGDTVAKALAATGFQHCKGCEERREALNRAVPYATGGTGKGNRMGFFGFSGKQHSEGTRYVTRSISPDARTVTVSTADFSG